MSRFFFCVLIVVAIASFPVSARCETPVAVTICELVAHPTRYAGHFVTFRAQAEGAWFEAATLGDVACKGSVVEVTSSLANSDQLLSELRESVARANRLSTAGSLRVVRVTLTGRFDYSPGRRLGNGIAALSTKDIVIEPGKSMVPDVPPAPSRKPKTPKPRPA